MLTARGARAESFDFNDETWQGSSELLELAREKIGAERVRLVATLDWEALTPADAIIVLHPVDALEYDELVAFLRAGGRVALLDDYGSGDRTFERFHISRIGAPVNPQRKLRGNAELAIAVPATQTVAGREQGRHPVVAEVSQLVTNHPRALTHPNLTPVLSIPATGEPDGTLAVTGIIAERGRLFAMADPSTVINLMMRYPGNRAFASGLIDYLLEDDSWGARGGNLYLVANRFRQKGSYGGESTLGGELSEHLDAVRDLIADMRRDGLPEPLAIALAAAAALGAAFWIGRVSTRPYRRPLPRFARRVPLAAQGGSAGRAAALAAGSTHRALVICELKRALEEALTERLEMDPGANAAALLAEIDRRGLLEPRLFRSLEDMLREMSRAENAVAARQPLRVSAKDVERLRQQLRRVLDAVDESGAT